MIELDGNHVTVENVVDVSRNGAAFRVTDPAWDRVAASRAFLERSIESGATIYGVNTGIGHLAQVTVAPEDLVELQRNIVRSHAAGTGRDLLDEEVRAILFLKINLFAKGVSGVRVELVRQLEAMLRADVLPVVPAKGSLGASGDLAPLAHVALAVLGEGESRKDGVLQPTADALRAAGLEPLELSYKEGLGLINGCQLMAGRGALLLHDARVLLKTAQIAAATILDVFGASEEPFDPKVHALRPYPGQQAVAANLYRLLSGERRRGSRVQDAYSLRCVPQILGGVSDVFDDLDRRLAIELNAASDNPLVFADEEEVIAAGNFHGESLALSLDIFGVALAEIASLAERQLNRLLNPALSGLPAFLAAENGKNSGLMILQYTSAALVSENKVLSHPASADSIPVSADQEDHVSMGALAAHKAVEIRANVGDVVGVLALAAAQAIDLVEGGATTDVARALHAAIRREIPFWGQDRYAAPDLKTAARLTLSGTLLSEVEREVGALSD